ncbi:WD40 repeat-like protein [Fomitiporia mediterranea MF3/22]|uniref:WD40 repeat-like protein n=1 Tax=Fomitiporia mediterranea (strain MF3/22) TaxID=694068 RepID=UPI0004408C78|nr:WD40 repeat-like protein [Fomitiporia mediterranea MF3/22]EJD00831.1 WD40 repeat-like protein [Fomitiporia mediterranea MF3/22]
MQQTGKRHEPIDIDDDSDGVEEVTNPPPLRARRLQKRQKTARAQHGSSQLPIVLDESSDDGTDSIVVNRKLQTLSSPFLNLGTTTSKNECSDAGPSKQYRELQKEHLSWQGAGAGTLTPAVNPQLYGLVAPAPSPSPKKPSVSPDVRERSPSILIDQTMKMELDPVPPSISANRSFQEEDEYISADDYWDWVRGDDGSMDVDDSDDKNTIDIEPPPMPVKVVPRITFRSSRKRESVKSQTLPRAGTGLLSASSEQSRARPSRLWDGFKAEYATSPYIHTTVDYRHLRQSRGLLSRATSSRSINVFNSHLTVSSLRLSGAPFKKTSGSVNKVAQSHEFIAVASPTKGGHPDRTSRAPEVDPYNRDGNLVVWRGQKHAVLNDHRRTWPTDRIWNCSKYYTVNDVAFDPLRPNCLVSSGNDCVVRTFDLKACDDEFSPECLNTFQYAHAPYDIAFKPNSSIFGVSCFDGNIHIHTSDTSRFTLEVVNGRDSRPGSFIWGATSFNSGLNDMLFASSESERENVCQHTAFNVALQCADYELDIDDSAEAMALDPQGRVLALITETGANNSHFLSLFDVARGQGTRCTGTHLHPLKPHAQLSSAKDPLEVTCSSFSPDGILLAIARTDNATHVYDVRFLTGERPWAVLSHKMVGRPRELEHGVTGLHWVEGVGRGQLGLVSGGTDGCVRLWDMKCPPAHTDESMVLAEVDHDVACFSVGDISKNEHRLVVGDCGGEVYIYD